MIDLLVLIQPLVEVILALGVRPEHVPIVAVRGDQPVDLKEETHKLRLALQHLVVDRRLAHLRVGIGATPCRS